MADATPTPLGADHDRGSGELGLPVAFRGAIQPTGSSRTASATVGDVNGRRRLRRVERDLHDGVQSELVALIIKLAVAEQDPQTPPALAAMLAGLEARAQAVLDAVRSIARGIYPPLLAGFGLAEALRAQAAHAAIRTSLIGSMPRSSEEAEEAVYFSCSEAIQNAAKHAGPGARVTIWMHHHHRTLTVRVTDDGRGFDPVQTPEGTGLESIGDRIADLGGSFEIASERGCGTELSISLPWPARAGR